MMHCSAPSGEEAGPSERHHAPPRHLSAQMIDSPGVDDVIRAVAQALCAFVILATALPVVFPRAKAWWIRIFDFPRLQLLVIGAAGIGVSLLVEGAFGLPAVFLPAMSAAAVLYQAVRIWRYTPLAPREVQRSKRTDATNRISLVLSNVLQENRDAASVLRVIREANPTIVLCVETDEWWREQLHVLVHSHPHVILCALPNTYGMLFYSRVPFEDGSVDFLIEDDVPSIQAMVRLASGKRVWINCLHPRPPAPGESDSSAERDAELVVVAKRVQRAATPVIVCGDLNDVAWSRTTRLFQKLSRLVDPRKGRGFFGTFHARYPFLRYPLDHVFHSDDFRLVDMRLLPYVGSDHFPVFVELSLEPDAAQQQEAPQRDAEDEEEGNETVTQAEERKSGESRR
jgi:endonuclease/exonuclease/phosphatase (EEP) superfamily protein YafD